MKKQMTEAQLSRVERKLAKNDEKIEDMEIDLENIQSSLATLRETYNKTDACKQAIAWLRDAVKEKKAQIKEIERDNKSLILSVPKSQRGIFY